MQNLKIRVNNEAESREAQELFLKYGATGNICLDQSIRYVCTFNGVLTQYDFLPSVEFKQITLPELRAMVNPMKEYLEKQPDGTYSLVLRGDLCKESDILIPEGAEIAIVFKNDPDDHGVVFYKNGGKSCMGKNDNNWEHDSMWSMDQLLNEDYHDGEIDLSHEIVWQREQDEPFLTPECTLNDQYAKIEQVRQAVKVKSGSDSDHALDAMPYGCIGLGATKKHNHYFKDVSSLNEIDVYMVLKLFNVTDPCLQHIAKKALCAGQRGHKDFKKDLQDILDTAKRAVEINN